MPFVERPDGARIHYETWGPNDGSTPLLLVAPGGVNSEIGFWHRSEVDPTRDLADERLVIGMDQRHAGESWEAPPEFSYDLALGDQLAVLDALGVERAHVYGGCIGVAYLLRMIRETPERVASAVGQNPVGIDHTNSLATFMEMFRATIELARAEGTAAVVASALEHPLFVTNNAGGPLARRLEHDPAFRAEVEAMPPEEYVALVERLGEAYWPDDPPYLTVSEDWLRGCPAPLLILPGSDEFHPTSIAERICEQAPNARCLEVDCRSKQKLPGTIEEIRAFLRAHS